MDVFTCGFVLWICFAITGALLAGNKGRSSFGWFVVGFFFGPVALIVLLLPPLAGDNFKRCPFCAEVIQRSAVKCRHCGSDLPTPTDEPTGSPLADGERNQLSSRYASLPKEELEGMVENPSGLRPGALELAQWELKRRDEPDSSRPTRQLKAEPNVVPSLRPLIIILILAFVVVLIAIALE